MDLKEGSGWHVGHDRDVFMKAEKWLTPLPLPDVENWTLREAEVAGFADYLVQLQSWSSMGSMRQRLIWQVGGPSQSGR